jgi:limonene-1,2-epoxide hydrolase
MAPQGAVKGEQPMDAEKVVREFCAAWGRRDVDEILAFFAKDAVYHNIPMAPAEGHDAIRTLLNLFVPAASSIEFEIHQLAVSGSVVLTERTDRFVVGDKTIALPVMGAFEVDDDGKITAWRDYFDMQQWTSQMG